VEKSWFSTKLTIPRKKKWSKTLQVSSTSLAADSTVLEGTKKPSKKSVPKKPKKPCLYCDNDTHESNKFLCEEHFLEHENDPDCNVEKCKYKATYKGFCGHHIAVPKPEDYIKPIFNTSRKIRLEPTKEQKVLLSQWFGVARKCYNEANSLIKSKDQKLGTVRDFVMKKLGTLDYVKAVPSKIKQEAVGDLIKATSGAIGKYEKAKKSGLKTKFQRINYKSKGAASDSINIPLESIKAVEGGVKIYPTILGFVKTSEPVPFIPTACRITCKYSRFYYLCVPLELVLENELPSFYDSIVAIDPGERNFSTFYSEKLEGSIGIYSRDRLYKSYKEADLIKSKMDCIKNNIKKKKLKGKPKQNAKNKIKHLRKKFLSVISKPTRLVKELHYKTAKFLCKNFDTILIPEYSSKDVAPNLCPVVNRSNQGLSHYSFRQRLFHTAKRFNRKVHIVGEAFTSVTCSSCGYIGKKNSNEYLKCSNCQIETHRDKRGARNIFIKAVNWFHNAFQ
jgi:putative transposase